MVVVCWVAPTQAQLGGIRGAVTDLDFEVPLPGVKVLVSETGQEIVTSDAGSYYLENLNPGSYTLLFSKAGYTRLTKPGVVVLSGQLAEVEIAMAGEYEEMDELVVRDIQLGGASEIGLLNLRMESVAMLDSVGASERTDLPKVAREVTQAISRRGLIIIVSDLLGIDELVEGLRVMRSRSHDVALFHVLHDDEVDFNFSGATRFEGLESVDFLNCNPRALREGYLEAMNEFLDKTRKACGRLSIDYMMVRTSDPLDAVLAKFLSIRGSLPKIKG